VVCFLYPSLLNHLNKIRQWIQIWSLSLQVKVMWPLCLSTTSRQCTGDVETKLHRSAIDERKWLSSFVFLFLTILFSHLVTFYFIINNLINFIELLKYKFKSSIKLKWTKYNHNQMYSFMLKLLYHLPTSRKQNSWSPGPIAQKAEWAPDLAWMWWQREKSCPYQKSNLGHPAHNQSFHCLICSSSFIIK
jgi:hypothetical protein